jgi:hypothetical protein
MVTLLIDLFVLALGLVHDVRRPKTRRPRRR